jgi:hypothetical protein
MKSQLVEHRLKHRLGITDPRQKSAQVGKSTPHPGKKILQGKSTTLAGCHHHSKHHQNKNETKTAQAGFLYPSRQKNSLSWGITRHPNRQKNKTKQNRPGRVKAPP